MEELGRGMLTSQIIREPMLPLALAHPIGLLLVDACLTSLWHLPLPHTCMWHCLARAVGSGQSRKESLCDFLKAVLILCP